MTGRNPMTLFLQLVMMAAVIPFAMIALEASRLGIFGWIVGSRTLARMDLKSRRIAASAKQWHTVP